MTLHRATLELDADVDPGASGKETGMFEMVGDLEVSESMNTMFFIASGQGSTVNAVTSGTIDAISDLLNSDTEITNRAGFHLDLGGGQHQFELNFLGWEGATDKDGNNVQWGDPNRPIGVANATGEAPLTQMQCLMEYLRIGEFDSRYPHARLRFGEYSGGTDPAGNAYPSGLYDEYIHVAVKNINMTRVAGEEVSFNGSLSLEETKNWTAAIDAVGRIEW